MKPIIITKASGEKESFSPRKLSKSLKKTGANINLVEEIVKGVQKKHRLNKTKDIYNYAFSRLKKSGPPFAARYSLKRAIMQLGPTGYPFEKFIGEVLKYQGYYIKTNQIIQGSCVKHEIDVTSQKGNKHYMVECKFHNQPGKKSDVKVILYIKARFNDVKQRWLKNQIDKKKTLQALIVTNTKFTSDAIRYANCAGVNIISWSYPKDNGLGETIEKLNLHPITALTSLSKSQKEFLIRKGVVLCRDIKKRIHLLKQLKLNNKKIDKILEESQLISRF